MNSYRGPTIGGPSKATASTLCQKCLKRGHYSYECKAVVQERPYVSRPSRTQQLFNPKLVPKLTSDVPQDLLRKKGIADEQLAKKELERERGRKRERETNDLDRPTESKRRRSASSASSISISTISTNASRSPSPPSRRAGSEAHGTNRQAGGRRRRGSSASVQAAPRRHRDTSRDDGRETKAESPPIRGRPKSRGRSSDSYLSDSRSRSRSPREPLNAVYKPLKREAGRSRSRSGTPPRQSYARSPHRGDARDRYTKRTHSRKRNYSRERRGEGRAREIDSRTDTRSQREDNTTISPLRGPEKPTEAPRDRSLSPFSQRVALTKAMNMGR